MKYCPLCENDYPDDVLVCPLDGATVRRPGERADPFIGRVIRGRYRVERRLGEGGMGAVYLAEQLSISRKVALKVLRGEFARDDSFVARFRQEAKLVAVLNDTHNPHVTLVHDFEQADDGSLFIVMEWLEGRTLNEVIQRDGALELARAVRLGTQIAQGLEAAHRAGVIHRDIKPHNIMVLDVNDTIKLMDFGIARLRDSSHTPLTRVGTMMGTPQYMAPEQIEGQDVTDKTDLYSFGIVLYEMLTGVVPFRASVSAAVLTKQLREEPTPPTRLRPDIPPELEELVLRMLQKNPADRPRDMGEVVSALSRLSRTLGDTPAPPRAAARTVVSVESASPAATIAVPTRPPASPTEHWPVSAPTRIEPAEPPPPAARQDTWLSETPTSSATVIVDRLDDSSQPRRPADGAPRRSRRALVVAAATTGAVLLVGALSWIYLGPPSKPPAVSTSPVGQAVSGGSSSGGLGASPTSGGTGLPAAPDRPVGHTEPVPVPAGPTIAPPVPRDVVTAEPNTTRPPRNEPAPAVEPRPTRPRPSAPSQTSQATAGKASPPVVASKPTAPTPDRLQAQVEDRLRSRGLLRGTGSDPDTGVTVEINADRVVILRGILRDPEQRDEAIQLARVAGVADVRPRINVQRSWN